MVRFSRKLHNPGGNNTFNKQSRRMFYFTLNNFEILGVLMKNFWVTQFTLALSFSLTMMGNFEGAVLAQKNAEINIKVTEPAGGKGSECKDSQYFIEEVDPDGNPVFDPETGKPKQVLDSQKASEVVELFYLRSATPMAAILSEITQKNVCLGGMVIQSQNENAMVLYGTKPQRETLKRVIAMLDLRREGVDMAMWGILISSDNPGQLAEAMRRINREIDKTREALIETYLHFQDIAKDIETQPELENLYNTLGYPGLLNPDRPYLSMTDILLRISATQDPESKYFEIAKETCEFFEKKAQTNPEIYGSSLKQLQESKNRPFGKYLKIVLPVFRELEDETINQCDDYDTLENKLKEKDWLRVAEKKLIRQKAILDFALNYGYLAEQPQNFNPSSLQKSAENLNSVLQPLVDAVNHDVEALFMEPLLKRIQDIVSHFGDVSYAEVGRTSVVGLNGLESTVASTTVSAFDETGPLRVNELLEEAGRLNEFSKDLFPPVAGDVVPASSIVSLVAALSKDRSLFRALTSGVSLEVTPSVLRNSTSAELKINLTTAPQDTQTQTGEGILKPLSRISQNTVTTSVYVNTLDLFALSTFNSQTTIDGGRTYIPVVGTIWKGIFSGVPIFGELFSWKNHPKNVQHQSIVLTNSFIVPTAMGLAPLYDKRQSGDFYQRCLAVENYIRRLEQDIKRRKQEIDLEQSPDFSDGQTFSSPPLLGLPQNSFRSFSNCDKFKN